MRVALNLVLAGMMSRSIDSVVLLIAICSRLVPNTVEDVSGFYCAYVPRGEMSSDTGLRRTTPVVVGW